MSLLAALGMLLVAEAVFTLAAIRHTFNDHPVVRYESAALVVFVLALLALRQAEHVGALGRRAGRRLVVGAGSAFQLLALSRPPVDSDDDFRYMWDAKVQLAGVDPYRYAPSSAALARLRDGFLFPSGHCTVHSFTGGCTRINLPTEHTIYPPVAEGMFTLLRLLSFGGHGHHLPLQLAAAAGAIGIGLLVAHRTTGRLWTVALWSWCPVVVMELGNNAHIDWLAVLFGLGALALTPRAGRWGSAVLAGVLLGAGIATKLYPALVGASMLRRRPLVVVTAAAATVVLVYVPHVAAVGGSVIGYLPTYLNGGGYGSGSRYHLIDLVASGKAATVLAGLILLAVGAWAALRTDPQHPERSALLVVGFAVLIGTPGLSWYTLLLLGLAAICGRPEWLGVVVAPSAAYILIGAEHAPGSRTTTICYLVALGVLVVGTAVRFTARRESTAGRFTARREGTATRGTIG